MMIDLSIEGILTLNLHAFLPFLLFNLEVMEHIVFVRPLSEVSVGTFRNRT